MSCLNWDTFQSLQEGDLPPAPRGWHSLSSPCGFDGARARVLLRALDPHKLSVRRERAATHHV